MKLNVSMSKAGSGGLVHVGYNNMYIPSSLNDVGDFGQTLADMYEWKGHILRQLKHFSPIIARKQRLQQIAYYTRREPQDEVAYEPGIFYTPYAPRTYKATAAE